MVLDGIQHIDVETVKSYAQDLRSLLEESDFTQSKSFLRSFVKKVIINGGTAKIQYRLPRPPDGKKMQSVGVLPIVTPDLPSVTIGRTFELAFSFAI